MRARDLAALEFPRVCAQLSTFAASTAGQGACLALQPTADVLAAHDRIDRTRACVDLIEEHGAPLLDAFADIRPHLRTAAHEGFVLDGKALVEVRELLRAAREIGAFFRRHVLPTATLASIPATLHVFPLLEKSLDRALDDSGAVLDNASDELARIRKTIRSLRDTVTRRLEALVDRSSMSDVVSDTFVTIRNNRFVVPIRAGALSRVPGVVQDRSMSGETFFVEPLFAVEMNNDLLLAVREEEAIVHRILADLTALVRAEHEAILATFTALVEVDLLLALAKFARAYDCNTPSFSSAAIELRAARHPVLLFTGRPVTPVDLLVPEDQRVLVVTGPNTGGKTVALKTLGLCAVMAQSGFLIPAAKGAELPCFSAVLADVGDAQNIEHNLSTFSAHIANLCDILAGDLRRAMVLLDEPGVGTDPDEGAALAIGLISHLEQLRAHVAITTHYNPVKLFALRDPQCVVAAVDFDVDTLTPQYRLQYQSLGRSLALPIAERLGLPAPVLAAARAAQAPEARALADALENLDAIRRRYEAELQSATERSATIAAEQEETRRLLAEARARREKVWGEELREARELLRTIKTEGRQVMAELRRSGNRVALDTFLRDTETAVRAHAVEGGAPATPPPPAGSTSALMKGDLVEIADRNIRGELIDIDGERAWIQRGTLRFEVPAAQLRRVGRDAAPAVSVQLVQREENTASEISLIGMRARDAVDQLHRFLDHAVQSQRRNVRVIHGLGSGALRHAVRDYLSTSPYCTAFRPGAPNEGGDGVTMVDLED
jgi:DNA mismatch repair protein MutS2